MTVSASRTTQLVAAGGTIDTNGFDATYAALLVQGALGLGGPANLAVDGGLLVLSTAVGLVAAWWLYEWRER